ncbi:MAG: VTT domain-containing protein [Andreesenia angusta]|nr:VTT domain-containing protein [Andreesenia angusta]
MSDIIKIALAMLLEGMSVPFPGIILLLTWGSLHNPDLYEILLLSLFLSAVYTIGSYIPYYIGDKLGNAVIKLFGEKVRRLFNRGSDMVRRFGVIVIAISRPFGWGNYISYIAGIAKINKIKYFFLTIIGIYPWCFIMLLVGKKFSGNISIVLKYINDMMIYIYIVIFLILIIFVFLKYKKYKKLKLQNFKKIDN